LRRNRRQASLHSVACSGAIGRVTTAAAVAATSGSARPGGPQLGAGDRQVAGQGVETKEGVALGGAQQKLRDDDGTGPLTHVSAS